MTESVAYIGVGANLGDRVQTIVDARRALAKLPETLTLRSSSLYWSSPVGYDDQPGFVNCVFALTARLSGGELFSRIQCLETVFGRRRDPRNQNAPRAIDLDLLLFNDQCIQTEELIVPHPRILERRFVIEPLLELSNDVVVAGEHLNSYYRNALQRGVYQGQELFRLGAYTFNS